ncbi:hypothetical protein [Candidatus Coxiella mudrowiae]
MNPNLNFLGIEVYRPGIVTLMSTLKAQGIQNVRICHNPQQDAVEVL